jgi:REP element-mobilizing transposase RayT
MSRTPRLQAPDVLYHVGSRGVEKRPIFDRVRRDRELFLDLLDQAVAKFHWRLYAYCLMGNHFHLLLDTPGANLSDGMQLLKGEYAQWLNASLGREGTLFERRFWSRIALSEAYVLELSRYIVLNPVRVGWARSPEEWLWSSYAATIGLERRPRFLQDGGVLGFFGGGSTARARYAAFVEDAIGRPSSDEAYLVKSGSDPVV